MNKNEQLKRISEMTDVTFVDGVSRSLVDVLAMVREERAFVNNAIDCVSSVNYGKRIGRSEAESLLELYDATEELDQVEEDVMSLLEDVNGSLLDNGIDQEIKERFAEGEAFYTEAFLNKQCEKVNVDNLRASAQRLRSHIYNRWIAINAYNDQVSNYHGLNTKYGKVLDNVGFHGALDDMQTILESRAHKIVRGVGDALYRDVKDIDEDEPNA